MRVAKVTNDLLQQVITLGDANKRYLGFYPKEAFERSAQEGKILGAVGSSGELLGYVLYYVAKDRAKIQHLCVAEKHRRKGVGKVLLDTLKDETKHLTGILLHCRRDFPAHTFWSRHFVAVDEKPGRGKKAETLTAFWHDHGHPDLFTGLTGEIEDSSATAVIDHNVLIDLMKEDDNESKALKADWLTPSIRLFKTDEAFNEIDRSENPNIRKMNKVFAHSIDSLRCDTARVDEVVKDLSSIMGEAKTPSDWSDRKQLAIAIVGQADFFITRDGEILKNNERLSAEFGLEVVEPLEIVLHFDSLLRSIEYKPARLKGTLITVRKISSEDIRTLRDSFLMQGMGERRSHFERRMREAMLSKGGYHGFVYVSDSRKLALAIIEAAGNGCNVPFLRVVKGGAGPILARNVAVDLVRHTFDLSEGNCTTVVNDPYLSVECEDALQGAGFFRCARGFIKLNCLGSYNTEELREALKQIAVEDAEGGTGSGRTYGLTLAGDMRAIDGESTLRVEKRIWPGKMRGSLENYIIPIKPKWAMHLFDEGLARGELFGAIEHLALSYENVYYRGAVPKVVTSPSRVLWYVSDDKSFAGSKRLRACSLVSEVSIGPARELYTIYKRLGVYEWKDILKTAHGNAKNKVMAIQFANTELFRNPLTRDDVDRVVKRFLGTTPPLSTALRIPEKCFFELYEIGMATV